jgi:hypothetical protein
MPLEHQLIKLKSFDSFFVMRNLVIDIPGFAIDATKSRVDTAVCCAVNQPLVLTFELLFKRWQVFRTLFCECYRRFIQRVFFRCMYCLVAVTHSGTFCN